MPGFTLWLTGLSGAGKSTVSALIASELEGRGVTVDLLDGDVVRTQLSRGLGFSREDRDTNIERIGWVASRLARAGAAVVVAAISPYAEARGRARAMTEAHAPFIEVWVSTSLEVCEGRDPKGLYARARAGDLPGMTGIDDPYEPPSAAEIVLDTAAGTPQESAARVIAELEARGLVPPRA
jgi:adenylyl-sulfate kinase